MISRLVKVLLFSFILTGAAVVAYAQPDIASPGGGRRSMDTTDLRSMLSKQRSERDRKDYQAMLDRGDQAVKLANQLEASFAEKKVLNQQDRLKLESLQEVVEKIRHELGADDDDDVVVEPGQVNAIEERKPSTVEEAFRYLQSTTVKLVDELKKTTRFTVSVVAIQSSNSVLRLVKFLRLRK